MVQDVPCWETPSSEDPNQISGHFCISFLAQIFPQDSPREAWRGLFCRSLDSTCPLFYDQCQSLLYPCTTFVRRLLIPWLCSSPMYGSCFFALWSWFESDSGYPWTMIRMGGEIESAAGSWILRLHVNLKIVLVVNFDQFGRAKNQIDWPAHCSGNSGTFITDVFERSSD